MVCVHCNRMLVILCTATEHIQVSEVLMRTNDWNQQHRVLLSKVLMFLASIAGPVIIDRCRLAPKSPLSWQYFKCQYLPDRFQRSLVPWGHFRYGIEFLSLVQFFPSFSYFSRLVLSLVSFFLSFSTCIRPCQFHRN